MIWGIHQNKYTSLFTDVKSERVLERTLSPHPLGVDYMMLGEIEREKIVYEH